MEEFIGYLKEIKGDIDYEHENRLFTDGFLKSFDLIQIVAMIKVKYGVKIPISKLRPENFNSAATIYEMIQELADE